MCARKDASDDKLEDCAPPEGGVVFDKEGKCPCGKSKEDCCHADLIDENPALHELCEPHNGRNVCEVASDLQKTAP